MSGLTPEEPTESLKLAQTRSPEEDGMIDVWSAM